MKNASLTQDTYVQCPACKRIYKYKEWNTTPIEHDYKACPHCGSIKHITKENVDYRIETVLVENEMHQFFADEVRKAVENLEWSEDSYMRIVTTSSQNIPRIINLIEELDEREAEYLPKNAIIVFNGFEPELVLNEDFYELNPVDLYKECLLAGIPVGFLVGTYDEEDEEYRNFYTTNDYINCLKMLVYSGAPYQNYLQDAIESNYFVD